MDGIGKLALPFGNNSKAKRHVDEAARILGDAERLKREAAARTRAVQHETREIVDLLTLTSTRVDVQTPADDYPVRYLLVDERRALEAIKAWKAVAEHE